MKRVKIMLLSLALFAVVGGALAFKAKYNIKFCTAPTEVGKACTQVAACPNLVVNSTTTNDAGIQFVCTTTPQDGQCPTNIKCTTTSTKLKID